MRKIVYLFVAMVMSVSAIAADTSRRAMTAQWMSAPRIMAAASVTTSSPGAFDGITTDTTTSQPIVADEPRPGPAPIDREREKQACISNNIGIGNTFVWASKASNTLNYSTMVEDVKNPENNVCFVRVEIKSDDTKISVSDISPVYFQMGSNITCGSWASEQKMRDRILAAGKNARTWGAIGAAVGGAGLGVGAMELFGNRAIGGAVMGQKALEGDELLRSYIASNRDGAGELRRNLKTVRAACEQLDGAMRPLVAECNKYDYNYILN